MDDTPYNLTSLEIQLKDFHDFKLVKAFSGVEALKKLDDSLRDGLKYSALFIDYFMPLMNGEKLAFNINNLFGK